MKIAIVYNRESQAVINLFGVPNKEKYGLDTIRRVKAALIEEGHQVRTFEGDKNIITNLETFMPKVISGERPGLVFNLSYGIQGKGRYMHMPGIFEMLGIPYVGSSPETHAIALDKVITKMILLQRGIPTPKFAVLETPDEPLRETLTYPLIVKPKSEAVSFGLRIVHDEDELRAGVAHIYEAFKSPTLVEEYIDGREVNVGLIGNHPTEALPPLELTFETGEKIFTFEDKTSKADNKRVTSQCPAPLPEALTKKVQDLAIKTFHALGCYDSARVDFRIDNDGNPYVLEVNSMASLGANASYVKAAEVIGLSYNKLIQKIIQVAATRYFGPVITDHQSENFTDKSQALSYITNHRDQSEQELKSWTNHITLTDDLVSKQAFIRRLDKRLSKLGIKKDSAFTDGSSHWFYKSPAGINEGPIFVVPMDIPGERSGYRVPFRKEPERLFGEGIATSRAGLVSVLKAFDALKETGRLSDIPFGLFVYGDEGLGMRYSGSALSKLSNKPHPFLIMHPSHNDDTFIHQRRGAIKLRVVVEGRNLRVGSPQKQGNAMSFFLEKMHEPSLMTQHEQGLSLSVHDINTSRHSMLLPYKVTATVYITYLDEQKAKALEKALRQTFKSPHSHIKTFVETLEERPPYKRHKTHDVLIESFKAIAQTLNQPFKTESTLLPSAAGLINHQNPVLCGLVPGCKHLYTPNESINRTEWVQKTLLLTAYLMRNID